MSRFEKSELNFDGIDQLEFTENEHGLDVKLKAIQTLELLLTEKDMWQVPVYNNQIGSVLDFPLIWTINFELKLPSDLLMYNNQDYYNIINFSNNLNGVFGGQCETNGDRYGVWITGSNQIYIEVCIDRKRVFTEAINIVNVLQPEERHLSITINQEKRNDKYFVIAQAWKVAQNVRISYKEIENTNPIEVKGLKPFMSNLRWTEAHLVKVKNLVFHSTCQDGHINNGTACIPIQENDHQTICSTAPPGLNN